MPEIEWDGRIVILTRADCDVVRRAVEHRARHLRRIANQCVDDLYPRIYRREADQCDRLLEHFRR